MLIWAKLKGKADKQLCFGHCQVDLLAPNKRLFWGVTKKPTATCHPKTKVFQRPTLFASRSHCLGSSRSVFMHMQCWLLQPYIFLLLLFVLLLGSWCGCCFIICFRLKEKLAGDHALNLTRFVARIKEVVSAWPIITTTWPTERARDAASRN